MKKLRRALAALSLVLALNLGSGALVQVRASDGPQGQQDSRSGGPSVQDMTQAEYEYFLWLILMWLLGW